MHWNSFAVKGGPPGCVRGPPKGPKTAFSAISGSVGWKWKFFLHNVRCLEPFLPLYDLFEICRFLVRNWQYKLKPCPIRITWLYINLWAFEHKTWWSGWYQITVMTTRTPAVLKIVCGAWLKLSTACFFIYADAALTLSGSPVVHRGGGLGPTLPQMRPPPPPTWAAQARDLCCRPAHLPTSPVQRDQNLVTKPLVEDAELQESESRNLVGADLRCLQCSCTKVGGKYHRASTWKTLDGNSLKLQLIGDPQRLGENLHARLKQNR